MSTKASAHRTNVSVEGERESKLGLNALTPNTYVPNGSTVVRNDLEKAETPQQIIARIVSETTETILLLYGNDSLTGKSSNVRVWADVRVKGIYNAGPQLTTQKSITLEQDPDLRTLRMQGPQVAPLVDRALAELQPHHPAIERLAYLLGRIGTSESMTGLLKALSRTETAWRNWKGGLVRLGAALENNMGATTWALWELSGRPMELTASQWEQWWDVVKDSFVPARDRRSVAVTSEEVNKLVRKLTNEDSTALERLIMLGPNAVPHLLNKLQSSPEALRYRIAWAMDEIGGTSEIPRDDRMAYFVQRIQEENLNTELGRRFRSRLFSEQSFDDYCRMAIEAARSSPGDRYEVSCWIALPIGTFAKVLAKEPNDIEPACAVLVGALHNSNINVRSVAIRLSGNVGYVTDVQPPDLLRALKNLWETEKDEYLRYNTAFAFARFKTPDMPRIVRDGLWSEHEKFVEDCARLSGFFSQMVKTEFDREAMEKLVELTHSRNEQIRRASVRALADADAELLVPHLERLCAGADDRIRKYCISAIDRLNDPRHLQLLFKLANDGNYYVRERAFEALGDPAFREAIPLLVPYLKDEKSKYMAQWAIVDIGGTEATVVLINELEQGNTVGNTIFQALNKLTGQEFKTRAEWLKWWQEQRKTDVSVEDRREQTDILAQNNFSACYR